MKLYRLLGHTNSLAAKRLCDHAGHDKTALDVGSHFTSGVCRVTITQLDYFAQLAGVLDMPKGRGGFKRSYAQALFTGFCTLLARS